MDWDTRHTEPIMVTIVRETRVSWSHFKANLAYALGEGRWLILLMALTILFLTSVMVHQNHTIYMQRQLIRQMYMQEHMPKPLSDGRV